MPLFILLGPEEGDKLNFLSRERDKVRRDWPDREEYTFFAGDSEEDAQFVSAISQTSLFSSYRFIVLKMAENLKRSDKAYGALEEFAENPQSDVTLVITSSETSPSFLPKAMAQKKDAITVFWELKDDQKRRWITDYTRSQGFQITQQAVDEILSSVDNNTSEMKNLVESITTFYRIKDDGRRTIDNTTIEQYTARTKGENGYTLFRAVGEGNLENALMILSSIILNDQRDLIPAFTVLSTSFRKLEAVQRMRAERKSEEEIFKSVTFVSPYGGRKSTGIGFRERDLYRKAMRIYSLEECSAIVSLLGRYDTPLKSAGTDMSRLLAERVIYTIVAKKGKETTISLEPPTLVENPF